MTSTTRFVLALAALLAFLAAPPVVPTATAGCGCDHPPPDWRLVMPPFAAPGREIVVYATDAEFTPGATYEAAFGEKKAFTIADSTDHIKVVVPAGVHSGPYEITVKGPGYDHDYPKELFTALAQAAAIPSHTGAFLKKRWRTAITMDGTLLLPIDLSQIQESTQFAFILRNLAYTFEPEDVVIYNADGVDLTLFTLDVVDSTERQWGSYYGWDVEDDTRLFGTVYDQKVKRSKKKETESDVFTYWRHEFHTYAQAHLPGGSHEVDESGYHIADGTLHIDHDHIVIAISGLKRDRRRPEDLTRAEPLSGGSKNLDVAMVAIQAWNPVEPGHVVTASAGELDEEEL